MINVDTTVHVSDVITTVVTAILIPLAKILVSTIIDLRDQVKMLNFKMGSSDPPLGVIGEVQKLRDDVDAHDKTLTNHREWLISIQDRRKPKRDEPE